MSIDNPVIALAGNPNVGKSSVFNRLTGSKQHTGNWPGKTVGLSAGTSLSGSKSYTLVDLPGTYSLLTHSPEEEIARDFLCNQKPDSVIIVCDATAPERSLNLALQVLEITQNAVLCVNLTDEAKKRGIRIDIKGLSKRLGIPAVSVSARQNRGLSRLMECAAGVCKKERPYTPPLKYLQPIEEAIKILTSAMPDNLPPALMRKRALELLGGKETSDDEKIAAALDNAFLYLEKKGISRERISDVIVSCIVITAEDIASSTVRYDKEKYSLRDEKIDKILTSPITGIPIMLLLFALVFYITVSGANIPSAMLSELFGWLENELLAISVSMGIPEIIYSPLICGVYHVLTWVIAVMLPPMAIFFPLFTFLEEIGYLPRIAFNLDKYFKKCSACGKQALTM